MVSTSPAFTAWPGFSVFWPLIRTWPASTSAAAASLVFTTRAIHSHLSRRWRCRRGLTCRQASPSARPERQRANRGRPAFQAAACAPRRRACGPPGGACGPGAPAGGPPPPPGGPPGAGPCRGGAGGLAPLALGLLACLRGLRGAIAALLGCLFCSRWRSGAVAEGTGVLGPPHLDLHLLHRLSGSAAAAGLHRRAGPPVRPAAGLACFGSRGGGCLRHFDGGRRQFLRGRWFGRGFGGCGVAGSDGCGASCGVGAGTSPGWLPGSSCGGARCRGRGCSGALHLLLLHAVVEAAENAEEILARAADERHHVGNDGEAAAFHGSRRALLLGEARRQNTRSRMRSARRSSMSMRTTREPQMR